MKATAEQSSLRYIFLDFDGVLHGTKYNTEPFCLLDNFEARLKPYEDKFKIVISSSWRNLYKFEELRDTLFLHLKNVVGVTPDLGYKKLEEERYWEIISYCNENKILPNYDTIKIIDDSITLFPEDIHYLILTDTEKGISNKQIKDLIDWIKNI